MKTIIIDHESGLWYEEPEYLLLFIKMQIDYLSDLCIHKGYVYLNTIYEILGIAWDPDDENICYRKTAGGINFEIEPAENGTYLIHIS